MRLINADTLKKTLGEWIRNYWTEAFTGDDAGSEFADMIEHAETIDTNPTVMDGRTIYDCNHDCEAIYEAYQKGKEDALKKINEEALKKIKK